MAREAGMDNINDISNNDREVPNRGAENNKEKVMTVQEGITEVQRILHRNRMLLKEMGRNYEASDLNHYAALAGEFNKNIKRINDLYSDLSSSLFRYIAKGSFAAVDGTTGSCKELRPSK